MDKHSFTDKIKEGISPEQLENFARKYTPEVFASFAIFVGAISSILHFFTGPGWAVFFIAAGAVTAIIVPKPIESKIRQIYSFWTHQDKTTEMILGFVQVLIAVFLPFIFFGFLGLLAGIAYQAFSRHSHAAKVTETKNLPATQHENKK